MEDEILELKKRAESGDAAAQCALGEAFHLGRGVKEDLKLALELFRASAEQGNAQGQRMLAKCLMGDRNYQEAVLWYRKAADQGHADAQFCLGERYADGKGVTWDSKMAVNWWMKAAGQGHPSAQIRLAKAYEQGSGVEKDVVKAIEWVRKAAEQGDGEAQFQLGECYKAGRGVERDAGNAVEWWTRAASKGQQEAQRALIAAYGAGWGVAQDEKMAKQWRERFIATLLAAAQTGSNWEQMRLAEAYVEGDGVEVNLSKAVEWWTKAAESGNERAQEELVKAYVEGRGVAKDEKKAKYWRKVVFEKKRAEWEGEGSFGQRKLAEAYENGEFIEKDLSKAVEWWEKAAEGGDVSSQEALVRAYAEGRGVAKDEWKAQQWGKKIFEKKLAGAKRGFWMCQYDLATTFESGGYGVEKDLSKALEWWTKLAEVDCPLPGIQRQAREYLAKAYAEGLGVAKDEKKAQQWRIRVFETKLADAERGGNFERMELADAYAKGDGVETDLSKAVEWWTKAAFNGDEEAHEKLIEAYSAGIGVKRDEKKAGEWKRLLFQQYYKGAEAGSSYSQCRLANAYSEGLGVEKDESKAVEWYKRAAEKRNPFGLWNLACRYESGDGVAKDLTLAGKLISELGIPKESSLKRALARRFLLGNLRPQRPVYAARLLQEAKDRDVNASLILAQMYWKKIGVGRSGQRTIEELKRVVRDGDAELQEKARELLRAIESGDEPKWPDDLGKDNHLEDLQRARNLFPVAPAEGGNGREVGWGEVGRRESRSTLDYHGGTG